MQHAKKEYGEVSEWPKEHAWKVCKSQGFEGSNPSLTASIALNRPVSMLLCFMASLVGPRAMIGYEPRQARKGATVAILRVRRRVPGLFFTIIFWMLGYFRLPARVDPTI